MVTFIESPLFTKQVHDYLTDEEYSVFQAFLATNPDTGAVVRGSGGVRKVRWNRKGTGKSGGVRVLYFARTEAGEIWLLLIYAKSAIDSIPATFSKPSKRRWNMPLNEKELLKRDAKRNIGEELLQAVRDIKAGRVGRVSTVEVSPLASARLKLGLSQSEFAKMLGVSLRTLQEWEQGRRKPSGAAKSLITIAIKKPEVIKELLAA
jgi:putative transcriptional regulator